MIDWGRNDLRNKMDYPEIIKKVDALFCDTFGADVICTRKREAFEHMGCFILTYLHLPSGCELSFENEYNIFDIEICDEEKAKNSLYRIIKYDSELEIKNIEPAIRLLKRILEKGDFCLYLAQDGKTYRKKERQYKRIRGMDELVRDIEVDRERNMELAEL